MTSGAKIGVALATGTGVVGGGVGLTYALKSENPTPVSIRSKIEDGGKNILSIEASKDSFWEIKLSTYERDFSKKITLNPKEKANLKQWSTDTLKKDFKNENDQDYSAAKTLCTVPTNSEKLLKENKELAGDDDWQGISVKYNSNAQGNNLINGINKNAATKENLGQWCKSTFEKEIEATGNVYTAAEKWCTKEGLKD